MLKFCSLFSGSSANCLYLESDDVKILIDCGASCKRISCALDLIGVNICDIDAILITHEHSDHTAGLKVISNKYNIPVYANKPTLLNIIDYDKIKNANFINGDFNIGGLKITPINLPHDAAMPLGYKFQHNKIQINVATDLGYVPRDVLPYFAGSQFIYIESNHDVSMLKNGTYNYSTKKRILSNFGHLSNKDCADFICYFAEKGTKNFMLGHLSSSNNTPDIALKESVNALKMCKLFDEIECICVAPCDTPSKVIVLN